MIFQPFILGSGRAGQAIAKSLAILGLSDRELDIEPVIWLERGASLPKVDEKAGVLPVLLIANPPGLHSDAILDGERAGFPLIFCEKPACVNLEQVERLRATRAQVAIFHVYRQMWGPQTLKRMLSEGEMGEVIAIEGRYWQSSTAQRALAGKPTDSWKNDVALSGQFDALLDVGSHWCDLAFWLAGRLPVRSHGWRSYKNAERPHRDSHVHVAFDFDDGSRAVSSISKTVHGATNHFEIQILGTRKRAAWNFLNPDEILIGEGASLRTMPRATNELGSKQPPFHAMGWLEGYVEIIRQALRKQRGETASEIPSLKQNLDMLSVLLSIS